MSDELDRVLRESFGRPPKKSSIPAPDLGSYDTGRDQNRRGQSPGMVGRRPSDGAPMARVLDGAQPGVPGVPGGACPEWMSGECLEILSRFLEETFRNFQVNARPPSHIAPPFRAKIIDQFPSAFQTINSTTFADLTGVSFVCPRKYRGAIWHLGQAVAAAASFSDLAWRVLVNGVPFVPYNDIRFQIGEFVPLGVLPAPLNLAPGDVVKVQARSISGAAHSVVARIGGWYYPVRAEDGNEVKSTIVD